MRHQARGEAEGMTNLVKEVAELTDQRWLGGGARQEPSIGGQRIEVAKEAQAVDERTDKRIYRDHAFGMELAEWHMHRPLIRGRWSRGNRRTDRRTRRCACPCAESAEKYSRRDRCGGGTPARGVDPVVRSAVAGVFGGDAERPHGGSDAR